jgi:hypothetical protein
MIKSIAVIAVLAASPALAADAPNDPPVTVEPQPPCTDPQCASVYLQVQDQCVWASNNEGSPVVLVLTLATGATVQFILKSGGSYSAANAPYDNKQCDSIERMVQNINQHERNGGAALAGDATLVQQLKTCSAQEMAAREANVKKDEYYDTGSRMVPRKSATGGGFMSLQTYPVYWLRLKNGAACFAALHDIKSFTADATPTIGSWVVSGSSGIAKAVLTTSAITVPPSGGAASGANRAIFQLQLEYGGPRTLAQAGQFLGSAISFSNGIVPFGLANTVFHVLADGKDVGQFVATGIDLRTMFGADLAGLASVQQISVVANSSPTANTTFFAANLQQTAAALAAMKAFADAM